MGTWWESFRRCWDWFHRIAEGIETALAVSEATGMVTWATISATLMERFVPPPGVERLLIWADNDPVKKGRRVGQMPRKGYGGA